MLVKVEPESSSVNNYQSIFGNNVAANGLASLKSRNLFGQQFKDSDEDMLDDQQDQLKQRNDGQSDQEKLELGQLVAREKKSGDMNIADDFKSGATSKEIAGTEIEPKEIGKTAAEEVKEQVTQQEGVGKQDSVSKGGEQKTAGAE